MFYVLTKYYSCNVLKKWYDMNRIHNREYFLLVQVEGCDVMSQLKAFGKRLWADLPLLGVFGFLVLSITLGSFELFFPVLPRVVGMFVSLAVLIGLAWLTAKLTMVTVAKIKEDRSAGNWWWAALLLVITVVVLGLAFSVISNANLLDGGKVGLFYLIMAVLVSLKYLVKNRRSILRSMLARPSSERTPRPQRERRPKAEEEEAPDFRTAEDIRAHVQGYGV